MANRVFVSMQEGVAEPEWFENVEPFVQTAMEKLGSSGKTVVSKVGEEAEHNGHNWA